MNTTFLVLTMFISALALASDTRWSVDELKRRFEVRGETYEIDPTGKIVFEKASTWDLWRPSTANGKLTVQWGSQRGEFAVNLRHIWEIQDDGSIKVSIEQFKSSKKKRGENDIAFEGLLKKEERTIVNLEPITFVALSNEKRKVVVRLTPDFAPGDSARALVDLPIAGQDVMITDNEGYIWTEHASNGGKYSGFSTYRGTVFMSYYPFPGSQEFGVASGKEIVLHLTDKKTLTLTSKSSYLPEGVHGKVFGIYLPDRKTGRYPSASLMDRGDEKDFVEAIKTWPN